MKSNTNPRRNAPRLADGSTRLYGSRALPPALDAAFRAIARKERRSVSWCIERALVDWATGSGIADEPEYRGEPAKRLRPKVASFRTRRAS